MEDVHIISDDYSTMQGFSGYQTEDLVAFGQTQRYHQQSPYSQYYTFHKVPLRSSYNRSYSELFLADPDSAFSRMQNHDSDLTEILDFIQTDWAHITPLDVIKFLSETPLAEMDSSHRARKTFLCREMHCLIQEDLRQSIQNQLMNEDLVLSSKNKSIPQVQNMNSTVYQAKKSKPGNTAKPKEPKEKESPEAEHMRGSSPVAK